MEKNKYLTVAHVAKKTGFTQDYIRYLIKHQLIKAEKLGNLWVMTTKSFAHIKRQRFQRFPRKKKNKDMNTDGCSAAK